MQRTSMELRISAIPPFRILCGKEPTLWFEFGILGAEDAVPIFQAVWVKFSAVNRGQINAIIGFGSGLRLIRH